MKIKKIVCLLTIICFSLCATGCGEKLYTMTDEEEEIITLYAAKMVSKFNKNQTTGICNARIREGELDSAYGLLEEEDTAETIDESIESTDFISTSVSTSHKPGDIAQAEFTLSEAIGIEGMEFKCSSFDISDEFKATSSFVLTRVPGKSYLVLYLEGTNTSSKNIKFDEQPSNQYKLGINNVEFSTTQNSFLDNDLSTYDEIVAAGETVNFVLVFQFSNSVTSDINALNLNVTQNGVTKGTAIKS